MYHVTALGEILIDFTPSGVSEQGNICFERNPGGAPANVLACISRLGGRTAFISKVGDDMFGHYLKKVLEDYKIEASGLRFTGDAGTTLAFVELDGNGERSFSFYRKPGADTLLNKEEVDFSIIEKSRIFHFGSLSLTDEPMESATLAALNFAKSKGLTISYDPNLRLPLWENENQAREKIKSVLGFADILKVSEEELEFVIGEKEIEAATEKLYNTYKVKLILVTRGAKGCFYRFKKNIGERQAIPVSKVIDTTGAGDAFLGGFLYSMISREIFKVEEILIDDLGRFIDFASATASICITKKGAIPSMPNLQVVNQLLSEKRRI